MTATSVTLLDHIIVDRSIEVERTSNDCQLHFLYKPDSIDEAIVQLNSDLLNIKLWYGNNGLKFNIDKCTFLHIVPQNLTKALSDRGLGVC